MAPISIPLTNENVMPHPERVFSIIKIDMPTLHKLQVLAIASLIQDSINWMIKTANSKMLLHFTKDAAFCFDKLLGWEAVRAQYQISLFKSKKHDASL